MDKEELKIYTKDMKFELDKSEEKQFFEDFEKFKNELSKINEIETKDTEILVSPTYDEITKYLREDEITDEVKNSKEAASNSKDFKDGFFTIPKVVS